MKTITDLQNECRRNAIIVFLKKNQEGFQIKIMAIMNNLQQD